MVGGVWRGTPLLRQSPKHRIGLRQSAQSILQCRRSSAAPKPRQQFLSCGAAGTTLAGGEQFQQFGGLHCWPQASSDSKASISISASNSSASSYSACSASHSASLASAASAPSAA